MTPPRSSSRTSSQRRAPASSTAQRRASSERAPSVGGSSGANGSDADRARVKLDALGDERLTACIEAAREACRDSIGHRPAADRAPRGAAVLTRRGEVFSAPELAIVAGVGGSAEQLAVSRARLVSPAAITHILVRGGRSGTSDGGPPTGATLQILLELAPRALLFWGTDETPLGGVLPAALLPGAFSGENLSSASAFEDDRSPAKRPAKDLAASSRRTRTMRAESRRHQDHVRAHTSGSPRARRGTK